MREKIISIFWKNKKIQLFLILLLIFIVNFCLRIFFISYPNSVVFDEAHFATYAVQYAEHEASFDIHPPLGKFMYGLSLLTQPSASYMQTAFLISTSTEGQPLKQKLVRSAYNFFPYQLLRMVSAFWGALLVVGVFFFVKNLTGKLTPALLAAFLLTFENALLLETRLILLNGIFLALGFFGLACLVKNKHILGGICIGLACATKLISIIFVFGGILYLLIKNTSTNQKRIFQFIGTLGITFLLLILLTDIFWVSAEKKIQILKKEEAFSYVEPLPLGDVINIPLQKIATHISKGTGEKITSVFIQSLIYFAGNTQSGGGPSFMESNWLGWPFLKGIFVYTETKEGGSLMLVGNPLVWGFATASIFIMLLRIGSAYFQKKREIFMRSTPEIFLFLLYIFYLLIFAFLIHRGTFLYHYFPALIFSICLFSILLSQFLETQTKRFRFYSFFSLGIAVFISFLLLSPLTYGF